MDDNEKFKIIIAGIIAVLILIFTPVGILWYNSYKYTVHKIDDITNYDTRKTVEDTCRAYIVSYESDKLIYLEFKNSEDKEEKIWSNNAKIRANKTAIMYNEYILKNKYVFNGNIPEDIREELEIIE